jgi:hypothetical protein
VHVCLAFVRVPIVCLCVNLRAHVYVCIYLLMVLVLWRPLTDTLYGLRSRMCVCTLRGSGVADSCPSDAKCP